MNQGINPLLLYRQETKASIDNDQISLSHSNKIVLIVIFSGDAENLHLKCHSDKFILLLFPNLQRSNLESNEVSYHIVPFGSTLRGNYDSYPVNERVLFPPLNIGVDILGAGWLAHLKTGGNASFPVDCWLCTFMLTVK